jgi:ATP-dependent DNA helicase Rep
MIGGQQFFERKEVKDLLAYMRLTLDPHDEMALRRIINYPARGIGEVALAKITRMRPPRTRPSGTSCRGRTW